MLVLHAVDWSNLMPAPFPVVGVQPMFSEVQLESIVVSGEPESSGPSEKPPLSAYARPALMRAHPSETGDPKMVILDCATKWKADLIVVGSHGHKGVTRFVSGSMSDSVALAMPIARSKSRTFPATANGFTAS